MSLYGALDKTKHFSEFNSPLDSAEGVLSPDERKRRAINNLMGVENAVAFEAGVAGEVVYLGAGVYEAHITLDAFLVGESGDNANKAIGAQLFTLPEGEYVLMGGGMAATIAADISVTSDTPEVGLGTVEATGAAATLGAVDAGCEDVLGPFVAASVNDGAVVGFDAASGPKAISAGSGGQPVYLNVADGWADVSAPGDVTVSGSIWVRFKKV